jgi:hypothetical protein
MAKKLYIETHGCQMNEYDSSRMVDLLGEHQALEVTARAEDADVILLNTCSIRERAQDRVYSQLGRWRELKLANPDMVIAVGGCVASQEGAAIRDRAPYVDVVFGPQTLHRLPEMPRALLFGTADIGGVAVGFLLAQLVELAGNALLQITALGQQQLAKEALLGFVHVVRLGLGEKVLFSHGESRVRLCFYVIL